MEGHGRPWKGRSGEIAYLARDEGESTPGGDGGRAAGAVAGRFGAATGEDADGAVNWRRVEIRTQRRSAKAMQPGELMGRSAGRCGEICGKITHLEDGRDIW